MDTHLCSSTVKCIWEVAAYHFENSRAYEKDISKGGRGRQMPVEWKECKKSELWDKIHSFQGRKISSKLGVYAWLLGLESHRDRAWNARIKFSLVLSLVRLFPIEGESLGTIKRLPLHPLTSSLYSISYKFCMSNDKIFSIEKYGCWIICFTFDSTC